MKDKEILTRDLLNAQAGKISWPELARFFAQGRLVCAAPGQDLLAVADSIVGDDADSIEHLHADGHLHRAMDEDARRWQEENTVFWAVVVAPWVLVQECEPE